MPDLGQRGNVMGPQPIAQRTEIPREMLAAVERICEVMAAGGIDDLAALSVADARDALLTLGKEAKAGKYSSYEIVGQARVVKHWFVKARLVSGAEPFLFQLRMGEKEGKWLVWEVMNLTGKRSAWTR